MRRFCIIILTLSAIVFTSKAQQRVDISKTEMEKVLQLYSRTGNAAGMGLFQPSDGSVTTLGGNYGFGDYHRAQEGNAQGGFKFDTERYDTFNDFLAMRGSFTYNYGVEKERIWSDVITPYNSNPFIYGSRVAKDYETHKCVLTFDLYTKPLADLISVGLRLKYEVADISGKRDPRPRTHWLTYTIDPSFLFSIGHHQIGADAGYVFSKEKLENLTTVQSYPNLWYYNMSGLEHCEGSIGSYSGFKRQFVGNSFTAGVQYGYGTKKIDVVVEARVDAKWENVWGDKMHTPGSYQRNIWKARAEMLLKGERIRHALSIEGALNEGSTDEYIQELQTSKDPVTGATTETWVTIYTYHNRFVRSNSDASLCWKTYGIKEDGSSWWQAGARVGYAGINETYYLPTSYFKTSSMNFGLEGMIRAIDINSHRLEIKADAGARMNIASDIRLETTSVYGEEVVLPDFRYYNLNTFNVGGEIRWTFPLRIKNNTLQGYLALGARNIFAQGGKNRFYSEITF